MSNKSINHPSNAIETFRNNGGVYVFDKCRVISENGKQLPFPVTLSDTEIEHKYPPIGDQLNRNALYMAQQLARFAGNCQDLDERNKYINRANFLLTAAYEGDEDHEQFWSQF